MRKWATSSTGRWSGRGRRSEQRAETIVKAEEPRAANDNVQARVFDLATARLDRDPEAKIGAIAMALERRAGQASAASSSARSLAGIWIGSAGGSRYADCGSKNYGRGLKGR
ncbi:hypothetical protein LJR235_003291 [Pararhizobium sp. LjRoot235]|uniref:hypothetical protein n=1 Tax=Pararhizobium sp. LjRoot235 TaxID=3342291 RepID=UPI003ECFD511